MGRLELAARKLLRRVGLTGPIVRLLRAPGERRKRILRQQYERERPTTTTVRVGPHQAVLKVANAEEFSHYHWAPEADVLREFFALLRPGDVVWDVGANVGTYTLMIARAVGAHGLVVAFEPSRECFGRLSENVSLNRMDNITLLPVALGRERAEMQLALESEGLEGDHRLVTAPALAEDRRLEAVQVIPGDELRREKGLPVPNWVKLDVQAAEEDVLLGMDQPLREPACRGVVCEIHYYLFDKAGKPDAPLRIEKHLVDCGFTRIRRLDRNHICAQK
jgi:FkbM family methyltransferase